MIIFVKLFLNILKKMIKLREIEEEFVYDLETVDGKFQAGIGEIIVRQI